MPSSKSFTPIFWRRYGWIIGLVAVIGVGVAVYLWTRPEDTSLGGADKNRPPAGLEATKTFKLRPDAFIQQLAFAPDTNMLVAETQAGNLLVWELQGGKVVFEEQTKLTDM